MNERDRIEHTEHRVVARREVRTAETSFDERRHGRAAADSESTAPRVSGGGELGRRSRR